MERQYKDIPRVSDQEAIAALKAWGIDIPTSAAQPEPAKEDNLGIAPSGSSKPKKGYDLGSKDVSLGRGWY